MAPDVTVNINEATPVNVSMGEVLERKEVFKIDTFTGDGTTTKITLSVKFRANSLAVWVRGVLQQRGGSYTEAADRLSFTFTTAVKDGWKGEARYVQD